MPTDHPDGTKSVAISRADIQTPIDIQHQTVNIETDFKAQSVGVYAQPEWAAKEKVDKNFSAIAYNQARAAGSVIKYTVPEGKTLYITELSFSSYATDAGDSDLNQFSNASIYNVTDDTTPWYQGGNGGGGMSFTKPIVIEAEHEVWFTCSNRANHNCELSLSVGGYEI